MAFVMGLQRQRLQISGDIVVLYTVYRMAICTHCLPFWGGACRQWQLFLRPAAIALPIKTPHHDVGKLYVKTTPKAFCERNPSYFGTVLPCAPETLLGYIGLIAIIGCVLFLGEIVSPLCWNLSYACQFVAPCPTMKINMESCLSFTSSFETGRMLRLDRFLNRSKNALHFNCSIALHQYWFLLSRKSVFSLPLNQYYLLQRVLNVFDHEHKPQSATRRKVSWILFCWDLAQIGGAFRLKESTGREGYKGGIGVGQMATIMNGYDRAIPNTCCIQFVNPICVIVQALLEFTHDMGSQTQPHLFVILTIVSEWDIYLAKLTFAGQHESTRQTGNKTCWNLKTRKPSFSLKDKNLGTDQCKETTQPLLHQS
ncbi:hypothetical protein VP01_3028g2 [Puccinia sorghi]|uniref:Uncharacterized protein n=1 Tax=Puccinia sorghi TaxID=27349 RepID=A0A0L6V071_9BASI|nr:hypothetical protein VP01_3028g2 [Puccinia sorghi]